MRGLLVKDLRQILQQKKFLVIMLLLAFFLNMNTDGSFVFGYLTFVGAFLVLNTLSYDEYDNTLPFIFTLPVERKTYAIEKYVFGLLVCGTGWLVGLVVALVQSLFTTGVSVREILIVCPIFIPLFMLMLSVMIPFPLIFGREKGTIVMMVVMSACIAIVYLCDRFLGTRGMSLGQLLDSLSGMKLGMLELLAFGVALLVFGISCSASVAAMKNKEL